MKTKIVFEQIILPVSLKVEYKVVHLTNRTRPLVDARLSEKEVNELRRDSKDLTIEIKPAKTK